MESFSETPLKDWRIGSASDKHFPIDYIRHHEFPGRIERWRPVHLLGMGAFGEVWKEKCERGPLPGKLRAVKRISKEQAGFLKASQRELQALATFSKNNDLRYQQYFVQFLGWFEDSENLYIAMDFMPHGDLQQYIDGKAPFPEKESSMIAKQVATGLRFMHHKGFLHRDLKPLNILVDTPGPEWKVKLADFGIARNIAGPTLYTHYIGTYGYIAPELFESSDAYTAAVDIWALGAVVFCMCTGAPPFAQPKHLLEYRAGMRCFPSQVLGLSTGFCIDFILGTMHANPRQRLEMHEIMEHEWLCMDKTVSHMMSNPITKHMSLRSFDTWDLKQAALDDPVVAKKPEPIDTRLTCLGCEQSFSARKDLFDHLAKNPNHNRDIRPGESSDSPGMFRRACMYCHTGFDNRNELFEHLEESGHALDLTNPRMGYGPEYKRPEECRKRDKKARKTIADLEKRRAEHHLLLQEQHSQQQHALQRRAYELQKKEELQLQQEQELQRRADELKRKEELQKQKEEEEKRQTHDEEMHRKKEEAFKALQKHQREVALKQEQEEFMMKQQEKQKRQRELDEAEAKQRQDAAQQRQAKRLKTDAGLVCRTCARSFDTRNQLFSHLKKTRHRIPGDLVSE